MAFPGSCCKGPCVTWTEGNDALLLKLFSLPVQELERGLRGQEQGHSPQQAMATGNSTSRDLIFFWPLLGTGKHVSTHVWARMNTHIHITRGFSYPETGGKSQPRSWGRGRTCRLRTAGPSLNSLCPSGVVCGSAQTLGRVLPVSGVWSVSQSAG